VERFLDLAHCSNGIYFGNTSSTFQTLIPGLSMFNYCVCIVNPFHLCSIYLNCFNDMLKDAI